MMKIDYNALTEEQLEERVEFIDWSMVPSCLITEKVKMGFSPIFKGLQIRMWFEDLLFSFEIKVDRENYPDRIFFFKGDKWFMDLDEKTGNLWCSYQRIWLVFEGKIGLNYVEIQRFIKSVVERHFKNMEVTPEKYNAPQVFLMEDHFKNMEVTPIDWSSSPKTEVEMHFKIK